MNDFVQLLNLDTTKDVAVGLSGGGDSMALTHVLNEWARHYNRQIHAITVDHNLRDNSADEAIQVSSLVDGFDHTTHTILTWNDGAKQNAALMEGARAARYDLMTDYCVRQQIDTLCIAHHADDQLETFLFRLAKGSGLDGLACMAETTPRDDIVIYRPFLGLSHDDLIQYCQDHGLSWIEDPSNQNVKFARPRIRQALVDEGLDAKRIANTVRRLQEGRDAIHWIVENAMDQITDTEGFVRWDVLQIYPHAVIVKCMARMIDAQNQKAYPPKLERIEEIVATIQPSKSATLHGCLITLSKDGKRLEIKKVEA